jgi:hypothetical protein
MPIPAIVWGAVAAFTAFTQSPLGAAAKRLLEAEIKGPLEKWALEQAFKSLGLTIDASQGFSRESITAAINAGPLAGTGVELSNVFDKEAVKADLKRVALARAVQETGLTVKTLDADGVKRALRDYVQSRVDQQLAAGGGAMIDTAKPLAMLARDIAEANATSNTAPGSNPGREAPTDFSRRGIQNRERQARYRAVHTRHWEAR